MAALQSPWSVHWVLVGFNQGTSWREITGQAEKEVSAFLAVPLCPGGVVLLRAIPPQLHFLLDGCLLWLFSTQGLAPVAGPQSSSSHIGPLNPPQTSVHFSPEIYYKTLASDSPDRHAQLPRGPHFPWGEASFQLQGQGQLTSAPSHPLWSRRTYLLSC